MLVTFHNTTYSKCVTSLNLRTPKLPSIKEGEVWDKEMVLNYLRSQPHNEELSLGYLGKKAATLVLLCTARRFKDVVNLNLSSCTRNNFQYTFVLTRPSKDLHCKVHIKCNVLQSNGSRIKKFAHTMLFHTTLTKQKTLGELNFCLLPRTISSQWLQLLYPDG